MCQPQQRESHQRHELTYLNAGGEHCHCWNERDGRVKTDDTPQKTTGSDSESANKQERRHVPCESPNSSIGRVLTSECASRKSRSRQAESDSGTSGSFESRGELST